jgi:uncharacterized protein YbcI
MRRRSFEFDRARSREFVKGYRVAIYLLPDKSIPRTVAASLRHLPSAPLTANGKSSKVTRKTPAEIEAAICERITRFKYDHTGREPRDIHVHLIGDLVVVRLESIVTAAEQQLAMSASGANGRNLVKHMRSHLIESSRPYLEAMVQEITGVKLLGLHYDISSVSGEEVLLFTLAGALSRFD